jgi:hypothetical protein
MRARFAAITMAALLALYLVFVVQYALLLLGSEATAAKVLGGALLVLPAIGAWLLVAEIAFVLRAERLVRLLAADGNLPIDSLPRLPSGRPDPVAADAEFPRYQAEVEANPDSWQAWFRLSLAYDASGDRKRARDAARRAIRMERASGSPQT